MYNLVQLNCNPSRAQNANILDVILCNIPDMISDVKCGDSIIKSDHFELNFYINTFKSKNVAVNAQSNRVVFNFTDVNWDEIKYHINELNLERIIGESTNVNDAWLKWKESVMNVISKIVPSKRCKNKKGSPWIDSDIIHLANVKHTLRNKAINTGKDKDWQAYKKASNELKNATTQKFNDFVNKACEDVHNNPKRFWSVASTKLKSKKRSIPNEVFYEDMNESDSKGKADLFNSYFYSQFNTKTYKLPQLNSFVNDNLSNLYLNVTDVYSTLIRVDINKAQGIDGIPTIIYRNLADVVAPSLTMMFNLSIQSGIIPSEWKWANIIPVFKKGDAHSVTNYRPISLLPIIGKILEKCIHTYIYNILLNDISKQQHGFMRNRSTNTQLVDFYDQVFQNIDNSKQVDIIYLDFSKAFDCIPHSLLIHKLKMFGFSGTLLSWITNYLTDRKQRVLLEGQCSSFVNVKSGVPQGSILGPLLFILYVNDMFAEIENTEVNLALYADDAKLSKVINSRVDCNLLQDVLRSLIRWSLKWGMNFNLQKCVIMSVHKRRLTLNYDYEMSGHILQRVTQFNDLGVIITHDLSWDRHIETCVKKANKRIGFVKRCIGFGCSHKVKLLCYISLIRPLLEYNTVTWACNNKKSMCKIESVQRRMTKYILDDYELDYKSRLIECNLLPLTLRRQYLDCIFTYNSINNLNDFNICSKVSLLSDQTDNFTRLRANQDPLMFKVEKTKHESYCKFYTRRIISLWNLIPYQIRSAELTEMGYNTTFKRELKVWLYTYFVEKFNDNTCSWIIDCGCRNCKLI
jgi:hypothetical protein